MSFIKKFFGKDKDDVFKSYENFLLSHTITGYLGSGSSGEVYKVHDTNSSEEFALKVVQFYERDAMYTLSMAEREVNCLQKLIELNHRHILRFYTAGVLKQWPENMVTTVNVPNLPASDPSTAIIFIKTELCSLSLKDRLNQARSEGNRDQTLFLDEMKTFALQLADALCYIHELKIMHRDINPSNIFLQGGDAKIGDFGLSRFIPGNKYSKSLTTGYRVGWYNFQSPEQRKGSSYTVDCDVFSLGLTFFEMFNPDLIEADRDNLPPLYDSENISPNSDVLAKIPEPGLRILLAGMLSNIERRPNAGSVYAQLKKIVRQ